jgi:hypothetical protein
MPARSAGQPINERVAVVEEKVDRLHDQLKAHEQHVNNKLDQILEGQRIGQEDRKGMRTEMAALSTEVAAMKPHVKTVADTKTIWKAMALIASAAAGVGSVVAVGWSYVKPWFVTIGKQ